MSIINYHLPIQDPTWIFFLVLLVILFAPLIFNKLRIPHLIGMILAGVVIGEHGLNLLVRDASFEIFGKVGMYYIMFLAGLQMDLEGFRKNVSKSVVFGLMTTLIPFALGFVAGYYVLHYSLAASLLLACIFASHTLVSYPIVSRYGLQRHPAVTVSIAATLIALFGALIFLAFISNAVGYEKQVTGYGLRVTDTGIQITAFLLYFTGVLFLFPRIIRWFFNRNIDRVVQYIFVITMVFFAAALAEICGIEGLLGAFLAGVIFNRFIPTTSPLMNRIEFVGNALFIPYFLVGVGMMVNLKPLFTETSALMVVGIMVVFGTFSKWLAALAGQKILRYPREGRLMMFGLTEAHAAGAIAMVMVGTQTEVSPGVPLMNNDVLDGVVVMILISCIISSLATDRGARLLRSREQCEQSSQGACSREQVAGGKWQSLPSDDEKIMVPVGNEDTLNSLIQTAVMMRNAELGRGVICLNVVNDADKTGEGIKRSQELLERAHRVCSASDVPCQVHSRLAVNLVNGVIHSMRENDASEIIIGLHRPKSSSDTSFLGQFATELISGMPRQITLVRYRVSIMTLRRIAILVPEKAEYEQGFYRWVERSCRLGKEIGCRVDYFAAKETCDVIHAYNKQHHATLRADYRETDGNVAGSLVSLKSLIQEDHMVCVVMARQGTVSYSKHMGKIPHMLGEDYGKCSVMMIYPEMGI